MTQLEGVGVESKNIILFIEGAGDIALKTLHVIEKIYRERDRIRQEREQKNIMRRQGT
jgi:hypothetical protein